MIMMPAERRKQQLTTCMVRVHLLRLCGWITRIRRMRVSWICHNSNDYKTDKEDIECSCKPRVGAV